MAKWRFNPSSKRIEQVERTSKRSYAAARRTAMTADWLSPGTSQNSEIQESLKVMRNRLRQLERDSDFFKGAVNKLATSIIGENGIRLQSQVRTLRGDKLDDSLNNQIESLWKDCSEDHDSWDAAGQLSLWDMSILAVKNFPHSGEILFRNVNQDFGGPVPFALEVIEADQLADDFQVTNYGNNLIWMGIEINNFRRPVAYHFLPYHPGDTNFINSRTQRNTDRITADQIIHLYITERPGQLRGVPWFHTLGINDRHLGGFITGETEKSRAQANVMGVITPALSDDFVESEEERKRREEMGIDRPIQKMGPGTLIYTDPGDTFQGFAPTSPGGNVAPFVEVVLRSMAAGANVSYESFSGDYSKTSFSSARTALLSERDTFRVIQKWFAKHFMNKVYKRWLEAAVLSGKLNIPRYWLDPRFYCQPTWICRGWDWVDPLKDVRADQEAVKSGFKTLTDIAAKNGMDIEELFLKLQREQELAAKMGLNLSSILQTPDENLKPNEQKMLREFEQILQRREDPKILIAKR